MTLTTPAPNNPPYQSVSSHLHAPIHWPGQYQSPLPTPKQYAHHHATHSRAEDASAPPIPSVAPQPTPRAHQRKSYSSNSSNHYLDNYAAIYKEGAEWPRGRIIGLRSIS